MSTERIFAEDGPKYRARGWSVFPVRGKIPCEPWEEFQHEPPHPDQIEAWCDKYPDANIGLATGKVSGVVVIDVDDEEGVASARKLDLPKETWIVKTGHGWHVYFAHPGNGLRIGNRAGLLPHLDVRGDGGYVVLPQSIHETGCRYKWITAPDSCPLAPIPTGLLDLLLAKEQPPGNGAGQTGRTIPEGQRNDILYRKARGLVAKGWTPQAIEAALLAENRERCRPPLAEAEVRAIAAQAATQPNRAGFTPTIEPTETPALTVPDAGMIGAARAFADVYARHLESPRSFFYFSYLTYAGSLVAKQATLDSELWPEPRLYTVLLGESSNTRKSTALRKADAHFRSLGEDYAPEVLLGAGSAEGLAKELMERKDLLLHYDEMKSFCDKAKAESSVLLPMVSTLFERGEYDNRTKDNSLSVRNASLSLLGAATLDTYATMFDTRFFNIGFLNRLWIVVDHSVVRIPTPQPIPPHEIEALRAQSADMLRQIKGDYRENGYRPVALGLSRAASELFREWYESRGGSIFEKRLDTYGHRLMVLLAVTSGKQQVDEAVMEAVLALLRYELEARREADPINAENQIAGLEERIRRVLARGPLGGRELKRRSHYERVGLWMWRTALENLILAREVARDRKSDMYALCPGVSPFLSPEQKRG